MFKRIIVRVILGALCLLILAGCGDGGSQTNGKITLTATAATLTPGLYLISGSAVYSRSGATGSLQNFPITITIVGTNLNGAEFYRASNELKADETGEVQFSLQVPQSNATGVFTVTASSGGLSDQELLEVPSIEAMTSSPAVVAFALDALAGSTQTVTISGGTAPYSASIDPAHVSDLAVSVNGNSIVLTKLKNSVANGPAILATLTVTDSSSATPIAVNVSYN